MNKKGILLENKLIIKDENNELTTRDYYEGIEEVLVQENVVETIEKEIQNLEQRVTQKQRYVMKNGGIYKKIFFLALGVTPFLELINVLLLLDFQILVDAFSLSVMSGISILLNDIFEFFLICGGFGVVVSLLEYSDFRDEVKTLRGFESKLSVLKKKLLEEKKKLEELQFAKEKTVSDSVNLNKEPKQVKIDDKQILKQLRDELSFYEYCGYCERQLAKYYQKDSLEKKLSEDCSEEEILCINQYLEEKGYQKSLKHHNHI